MKVDFKLTETTFRSVYNIGGSPRAICGSFLTPNRIKIRSKVSFVPILLRFPPDSHELCFKLIGITFRSVKHMGPNSGFHLFCNDRFHWVHMKLVFKLISSTFGNVCYMPQGVLWTTRKWAMIPNLSGIYPGDSWAVVIDITKIMLFKPKRGVVNWIAFLVSMIFLWPVFGILPMNIRKKIHFWKAKKSHIVNVQICLI